MVRNGSLYNCGIIVFSNCLEDIPKEVIENRHKDPMKFIGHFVARCAQAIGAAPPKRVVLIVLKEHENFLIPYFSHLGFRLSGICNGEAMMSLYFKRAGSCMAGGVGKCIRRRRALIAERSQLQREQIIHSSAQYRSMWKKPESEIESHRAHIEKLLEPIVKEEGELLISVPPEYLGYWKRFSEDGTKALERAWPS